MDRPQSDLSGEVAVKSEDAQKMDEIRNEMEETRTALADKLEALQDKVLGTVEKTVETVQETVEAARRTFDLRYQTEEHPWRMVGLAALTGTAVGYLLSKPTPQPAAGLPQAPPSGGPSLGYGRACQTAAVPPPVVAPAAPGPFAEEWHKVKGLAIGTGMALLRDWLKEAVPPLTEHIDQLCNNVTSKIGGVKIEDPILGARAEQPSGPRAWSAAG